MNALEKYRRSHGLTYEALGQLLGCAKNVAWKYCKEFVPAEAAIKINAILGIDLKELRPDIYASNPPAPAPASEPGAATA
jgi:transcriptional regulator with XRE-family HTH domain